MRIRERGVRRVSWIGGERREGGGEKGEGGANW